MPPRRTTDGAPARPGVARSLALRAGVRLGQMVFLAVLAGCPGPEHVLWLDLGGRSLSLSFLAVLSAEGSLERASEPIVPEGGELPPEGARFDGWDPEETLLLSVDLPSLLDEAPGLAMDRLGQSRLVQRVDGEASSSIYADPQVLELPASTQIFELVRKGESAELREAKDSTVGLVREALRFRAPVNPEFCDRFLGLELAPFGARAQVLPGSEPGGRDQDLRNPIALDADHVLVTTPGMVAVVGRGEEVVGPKEGVAAGELVRALRGDQMTPPLRHVGGVALDPGILGNGRRRAWLVGVIDDAAWSGGILELEVGTDGLRLVGTATVSYGTGLYDVLAEDGGGIVAVGDVGTVVSRRPGESVFHRGPNPIGRDLAVNVVIATPDLPTPHLIGVDAKLVVAGDAYSGRWQEPVLLGEHLGFGIAGESDIFDVALGPRGDRWAVGDGAMLSRAEPGERSWTDLDLLTPPSLRSCSRERLIDQGTAITGIAAASDAVFLVPRWCSALFALDLGRDCLAPIPIRDVEIVGVRTLISSRWAEPGPSGSQGRPEGRRLLVGGSSGTLYELALP